MYTNKSITSRNLSGKTFSVAPSHTNLVMTSDNELTTVDQSLVRLFTPDQCCSRGNRCWNSHALSALTETAGVFPPSTGLQCCFYSWRRSNKMIIFHHLVTTIDTLLPPCYRSTAISWQKCSDLFKDSLLRFFLNSNSCGYKWKWLYTRRYWVMVGLGYKMILISIMKLSNFRWI